MKKSYQIGIFAAVFVAGFVLAWVMSNRRQPTPSENNPPPQSSQRIQLLETKKLVAFLEALGRDDYTETAKAGEEAFPSGTVIPEHKKLFAEFAAGDIPPFATYVFMSGQRDGSVVRILLTIDAETGKVESFLAEAMPIV